MATAVHNPATSGDIERYYIDVYIQGTDSVKVPKQTYRIPVASYSHTRFPVTTPLPDIPKQDIHFTKMSLRPRILHNADEVCRYEVSKDYVSSRIVTSTILMVMFEAATNPAPSTETTRGFILGQFTKDNGMYLDVVCSSKYGLLLIDYFVILARKLGMSYIKLNSLPKVLSLYPRYGFRHRKSCRARPDVEMPPELITSWKQFHNFSPDDFYADPTALYYMHTLHRYGYTADDRPECQDPTMSMSEFALNKCAMDGFKMYLCFDPPQPSRKPATLPQRVQGTMRSLRVIAPRKEHRDGKGKWMSRRFSPTKKGLHQTKKKAMLRRSARLQAQAQTQKMAMHSKTTTSSAMNID